MQTLTQAHVIGRSLSRSLRSPVLWVAAALRCSCLVGFAEGLNSTCWTPAQSTCGPVASPHPIWQGYLQRAGWWVMHSELMSDSGWFQLRAPCPVALHAGSWLQVGLSTSILAPGTAHGLCPSLTNVKSLHRTFLFCCHIRCFRTCMHGSFWVACLKVTCRVEMHLAFLVEIDRNILIGCYCVN